MFCDAQDLRISSLLRIEDAVPSLAVQVPAGVDWAALCKNAMDKYNVEISGGLGPSVGKVRDWCRCRRRCMASCNAAGGPCKQE
jgi:hypothetical protein